MKIKEITSQSRRDFWAIYVCEHCGQEERRSGYDDAHFHSNVVPSLECGQCGKKSPADYRPLTTKHDASVVV